MTDPENTDEEPPTEHGRNRLRFVTEVCDLTAESLVGSWFHAAMDYEGVPERQGAVVAEPQPGMYLVDEGTHQRVVTIQEMMEEGWVFYDSDNAMRVAFAARTAQAERE